MSNSQTVQVEPLRSLAEGSITTSYAAVGTPFLNPIRIMCITNNTDGDMIFSIDGVNAHFFLPKSSFRLYDFTTNKKLVDQLFAISQGVQIYVKYSTMPSTGSVYVEAIYGSTPNPKPGGL